jgi:hypothetical protein
MNYRQAQKKINRRDFLKLCALAGLSTFGSGIACRTLLKGESELPTLDIYYKPGFQVEGTHFDASLIAPGSSMLVAERWNYVEAKKGTYDWHWNDDENGQGNLEYVQAFRAVSDGPLIVGVKNSPYWARCYPQYNNSPPNLAHLQHFNEFIQAVVDRYDPEYIEIWNEPNAPLMHDDKDDYNYYPSEHGDFFGGFGGEWEKPDLLYEGSSGPAYYAYIVNVVGRYVHDHCPGVKVLAGALANGWDRETNSFNPFYYSFLSAVDSESYDGLSYHAYPIYIDPAGGTVNERRSDWNRILRVADLLRALGAPNKEIVCTETSLLAPKKYAGLYSDPRDLENEQVAYLNYVHQNAPGHLNFFLWYTLTDNDWEWSDLGETAVDCNQKPYIGGLPGFHYYYARTKLLWYYWWRCVTGEFPQRTRPKRFLGWVEG